MRIKSRPNYFTRSDQSRLSRAGLLSTRSPLREKREVWSTYFPNPCESVPIRGEKSERITEKEND